MTNATLERQTYKKCLEVEGMMLRWYLDTHWDLTMSEFKQILADRSIDFIDFIMKSKSVLMSAKFILQGVEDEE